MACEKTTIALKTKSKNDNLINKNNIQQTTGSRAGKMNVFIRKEELSYYESSPKFCEYPLECIDKRKTKIKKIHQMYFEKAGEKLENTQIINKNGRKADMKFIIITKDEFNRPYQTLDKKELIMWLENVDKELEERVEEIGEKMVAWEDDAQLDKQYELVKRATD